MHKISPQMGKLELQFSKFSRIPPDPQQVTAVLVFIGQTEVCPVTCPMHDACIVSMASEGVLHVCISSYKMRNCSHRPIMESQLYHHSQRLGNTQQRRINQPDVENLSKRNSHVHIIKTQLQEK